MDQFPHNTFAAAEGSSHHGHFCAACKKVNRTARTGGLTAMEVAEGVLANAAHALEPVDRGEQLRCSFCKRTRAAGHFTLQAGSVRPRPAACACACLSAYLSACFCIFECLLGCLLWCASMAAGSCLRCVPYGCISAVACAGEDRAAGRSGFDSASPRPCCFAFGLLPFAGLCLRTQRNCAENGPQEVLQAVRAAASARVPPVAAPLHR